MAVADAPHNAIEYVRRSGGNEDRGEAGVIKFWKAHRLMLKITEPVNPGEHKGNPVDRIACEYVKDGGDWAQKNFYVNGANIIPARYQRTKQWWLVCNCEKDHSFFQDQGPFSNAKDAIIHLALISEASHLCR